MKVLVFAPHSAIWIHAFPEALIAESLQQAGHSLVYVTCGRLFGDYCIPMSAAGIKYDAPVGDKQRVCDRCVRNAHLLRQQFDFRGSELASALSDEDRAEIGQLLTQISRANFRTIELEGIQVGRLALYQFLILRKKLGFDFSAEEWNEYLLHVKATASAVAGLRHIFKEEKPDRVLLYNGLYSVNMACRELAARNGAISYFLHAGGGLANRLQTLMLGRGHAYEFYASQISHWPKYRSRAVSRMEMQPVTNHFVELLRGRSAFVYSASKSQDAFDVRRTFGIEPGKRIVVATMSSYDEEFAAESIGARVHDRPPLFANQVEWIRQTVDYVSRREDLFLIIRVHPRELPNRREDVKSEHAAILEKVLVDLPGNAVVNWPTDGISLYDLAEEADVFLNSWSSAGKEMSLLGRPVVTYAKEIIFYPVDLNYTSDTIEGYFAQVEQALVDGWDAERIRTSYRWMAIEYGKGLIDIGDSFFESEHRPPSIAARVVRKVRRVFDEDASQRGDCDRRAKRLQAAGAINRVIESGSETVLDLLDAQGKNPTGPEEETEALRGEIARLMRSLYPNAGAIRSGTLRAYLSAFAGAAMHE